MIEEVSPRFACNVCDYNTSKKSSFDKHTLSAKHILLTDVRKIAETEVAKRLECKHCDYITSKKSNYDKHMLTAKHIYLTSATKTERHHLTCGNCNKKYNSRVGLWGHKKKCTTRPSCDAIPSVNNIAPNNYAVENNVPNAIPHQESVETAKRDMEHGVQWYNTNLIIDMMKDNQEFKSLIVGQQTMLLEQQKENKQLMNKMVEITQTQLSVPSTVNTTINHNNNQKCNLNFFLNETCKDAMSIQEFIENIKISFEDLLTIGNTGFVNGVSDIFLKQLKDLDVTKRPIHCTDSKRETIYLKENDAWNKDDKENNKLKDVIEKVEKKNVLSLHKWCNDNPDSKVNNTPNNLLRDKIFLQTLQGDEKTRDKIIRNIAKEVVV